ncbi:hypothetical protein [Candidatus Protochlamydia phocaeensis]|uniref:hypothetical protein n=1 Tax=Candidatus Protochlamydia phocaeensis TaxID=1414722 RepID=UPI0008386627|nr:hypothetical protein [Candidatus Protochlamydia phocaeensis]
MNQNQNSPYHHAKNMQQRLKETTEQLREALKNVDEPQFKAMFETSAEVLNGLIKAFEDYKNKHEQAWKK